LRVPEYRFGAHITQDHINIGYRPETVEEYKPMMEHIIIRRGFNEWNNV